MFILRPARTILSFVRSFSSLNTTLFVSVHSQKETLSEAVGECVNQLKTKFNNNGFQFTQLLVSQQYGEYVPLASSYFSELMGDKSKKETMLIGGTVQDIILPGQSVPQQGVSLLAGQIPEASIYTFRTDKPALPNLQGDVDWTDLFNLDQQIGKNEGDEKLLGLLLSEPYFVEVDRFLRLLSNLFPYTPIVGGIVHPISLKLNSPPQGTLFLNEKVLTGGAVGCLIRGKMKIQESSTIGGQAVGPVMRVTRSQENMVLELDGRPALSQLMQVLGQFKHQNIPINIAVDEDGKGKGFVLRNLERVDHEASGVVLSMDEIIEGTNIQIHVRNDDKGGEYLKQHTLDVIDKLTHQTQPHQRSDEVGNACMLMYSCVGVEHKEGLIVADIPNNIAFQGAKFQGEIGPLAQGVGGGVVHSYTSTIAGIGC